VIFQTKIICLPTISLGLQNEGAVLAEALDGKAKVNLLWINRMGTLVERYMVETLKG